MTTKRVRKVLWMAGLVLFLVLFGPKLDYPAHGETIGADPYGWGSHAACYL